MKTELETYLALPYTIEIVPIAPDEGGGFLARLPQFGKLGIAGDGDTIEEALNSLFEIQRDRFKYYIDEGLEIPQPVTDEDDYSGKFVLRVPKFLHRELAESAKKNGVSLNQYVSTLLAASLQSDRLTAIITGLHDDIKSLNQCIGALSYDLKRPDAPGNYEIGTIWADGYPVAA